MNKTTKLHQPIRIYSNSSDEFAPCRVHQSTFFLPNAWLQPLILTLLLSMSVFVTPSPNNPFPFSLSPFYLPIFSSSLPIPLLKDRRAAHFSQDFSSVGGASSLSPISGNAQTQLFLLKCTLISQ